MRRSPWVGRGCGMVQGAMRVVDTLVGMPSAPPENSQGSETWIWLWRDTNTSRRGRMIKKNNAAFCRECLYKSHYWASQVFLAQRRAPGSPRDAAISSFPRHPAARPAGRRNPRHPAASRRLPSARPGVRSTPAAARACCAARWRRTACWQASPRHAGASAPGQAISLSMTTRTTPSVVDLILY